MSKAEQFIKDYTKHCTNIIEGYDDAQNPIIDYYPWLTPDQALRAVEIAREEIKAEIERLIKSYSPIWSSEGKYRVEAYKEVLDIINSNFLNISRSGNSHIGENRELERIISKACEWLRQHMKTLPELSNKDLTKYTLWKRDEIIDKFRQAMEE